MSTGSLWLGVVFIGIGRFADVLDGIVAERTLTKSPLGEAVDATIDKILLAITVITIFILNLIPTVVLVLITLHGIYNILLYVVAHFKKSQLHPSLIGKLTASAEWISIGLFVIAHYLHKTSNAHANYFSVTALILFGLFLGLAITSSYKYYIDLFYKTNAK
jgi:phosphatidylglycerophosphate synthase